jgi:ornithine carbamoyltransferase
VIDTAHQIADRTGAQITITDDPAEAVRGVDFIHTDVWVSMGEPKDVWTERVKLLSPYQVNAALLESSGKPQGQVHALPARVP